MDKRSTLIHLLPPASPSDHGVNPGRTTSHVLFCRIRDEPRIINDSFQLKRFSKILFKHNKDEIFHLLKENFVFIWTYAYDTVNPFGDYRQFGFEAVWNFDIQNDILIHTNRDRRAILPLALLRTSAEVTMTAFQNTGPPVPPLTAPTFNSSTLWKPDVQVDERSSAYLYRILHDFNRKWRHVLRNEYNNTTLRVMARAVIRLATLDFEVRENDSETDYGGQWVRSYNLPKWKPFDSDIVSLRDVVVVICQSPHEGLSKANDHAKQNRQTSSIVESRPQYMLLSIKHIMLCKCPTKLGEPLIHTVPEPLFTGDPNSPPSDLALSYLLWALSTSTKVISTLMRRLPIELQDQILSPLCAGPVARAHLGCLLSAGSSFSWNHRGVAVKLEKVRRQTYISPNAVYMLLVQSYGFDQDYSVYEELEAAYRDQELYELCEKYGQHMRWKSVESQIWLGGVCSGVVYDFDFKKAKKR